MSNYKQQLVSSAAQKGLHPIASVLKYPKLKPTKSTVDTRGCVFRIQKLHQHEMGPISLERNRRGFTNSSLITAAIAPSLYHWLFQRCGISFGEAKALVSQRRLTVDGVVVTAESDLECQLRWSELEKMNISALSSSRMMMQSSSSHDDSNGSPVGVELLKRALHRTYAFMCVDRRVSIKGDVADPRSFLHVLQRNPPLYASPSQQQQQSSSGDESQAMRAASWQDAVQQSAAVNILRPCGFVSHVCAGLVVATNDTCMVRSWNNEYLGNFGVYDIRFPHGAPSEMYNGALADIEQHLAKVRHEIPCDTAKVRCQVVMEKLPDGLRGKYDVARHIWGGTSLSSSSSSSAANNNNNKGRTTHPDTSQRLLVETPLLPYRCLRKLKANGALLTCVKMGPFSLTKELVDAPRQRLLNMEELMALFAYEKRMKTCRLVHTLKEFDVSGGIEGGGSE